MEKKLMLGSIVILCLVCLGFIFFAKSRTENPDEFAAQVSIMESIKPVDDIRDSRGESHDMQVKYINGTLKESFDFSEDFYGKTAGFKADTLELDYPGSVEVFSGEDSKALFSDILYQTRGNSTRFELDFHKYLYTRYLLDGDSIFLDFYEPREVFDKVVIVDPAFGGSETGAVGEDIPEKDINLKLAKKVEEKIASSGKNIGVYLTRKDDINLSDDDRLSVIKDFGGEMFVRLQQNSTASGRASDVNGIEALYFFSDTTNGSRVLATRLVEKTVVALGSENRGILAGDEEYILRECPVKAAILKLGYMSNHNELLKLTDEVFLDNAATAIAQAILEELYEA